MAAEHKKTRLSPAKRVARFLLRLFLLLLETLLLAVIALYAVMFVLAKGPSPTARDEFVMSVRETSAIGFLADLFFNEDEIAAIEAKNRTVEPERTDASLVQIKTDTPQQDTPEADAWGLIDDDGDGIIVQPVKGAGFNGYMMVVLDPSRVIMGCRPDSFGVRGYSVEEYVQHFDAVAGINAGGFYDPEGMGDGSIPDSLVVFEGEIYYSWLGVGEGFVGFDDQYVLHVGRMSAAEIRAANIQYGVCFGPALVINGQAVDRDRLASGVNPRTAIGQRSDGAVLMLVIDGRMATSLGARYADLVDIMLEYGAVNAANLDGGSSSLLYYRGNYLNNKALLIGVRNIPSSFLVLKEAADES